LPAAERGFSCILSFTLDSAEGVAASDSAEGSVLRESSTINGGQQGVQALRLDRHLVVRDQTALGQQVFLDDRVEEVIGHVQCRVNQAGR
jgi:hypothetical protein